MEAGTADRTKLAEKKKDGPSRAGHVGIVVGTTLHFRFGENPLVF
jgi:hypothetical protein